MSKTLTLYTRADCPLCEEMALAVGELIAETGHRLVPLDVDADPSPKLRYGWEVPLLFDGPIELCRHELDRQGFLEWLRANS